jgi:hypothetical protein
MEIPPKPVTGQDCPIGYDLRIWNWIRSMRLRTPGRYLRSRYDQSGQVIDFNFSALLEDLEKSTGTGSTNSSVYNGQFKVVKDGETYKVINGADPNSAYCGYVGLPGVPQIGISVPVKTGMTTPVCYLRTKKDGESYVSAVYEYDGTSPADNEDWVQLAAWNSTLDNVEQVWTGNNHFINYRWM